MTRTEFEEEVLTFSSLIEFDYDESLYILDDIISGDEMEEEINEYIRDFNGGWEDLRDRLNDIDTGYEYYRRDGYLEYTYMDDNDFDRYKQEVLDAADANELWDSEEEGEDDERNDPEEDVEEASRKNNGYYFTDPITGEILVAGYAYEKISSGELNDLFL